MFSRAAGMLLVMLLFMMTAQTAWADSTFSGGSGSSADPYLIKTIDDLNQLATRTEHPAELRRRHDGNC